MGPRGGGQGTHMMASAAAPAGCHYFVQAGHPVYWVDRPVTRRFAYHADALGPAHFRSCRPYERWLPSHGRLNTGHGRAPTQSTTKRNQFMAVERGNIGDEALIAI